MEDYIFDLSWFVEEIAYHRGEDNPRRKKFENKLKQYFEDNNLEIVKKNESVPDSKALQ